MSAFKNFAKSFNLLHAIGFSLAIHLVLLIFSPALPANTTLKHENKIEEVHLEIIKKSKPPQVRKVQKKKSMPIMKKTVFNTRTKTFPKPTYIKPLRAGFTQSVSLKPASKLSVSRKASPITKRLHVAFLPISRSANKGVSSIPYAKRAVSGVGYSNLLHDSKTARKVSSFTSSNNMQAGMAVRVSTRSFSSSSFTPTARVIKNIMSVAKDEGNSITGDDFKEIWGQYTNSIQLKIAQAKTYPSIARERKQQGKAFLSFKLDKDGRVLELSIENSSGYKILDQAAIKAIKEAAPFPTIPASLNKKYASLKIPISFVLR
jgi:TonB family protein